jgi:hypothetical protein
VRSVFGVSLPQAASVWFLAVISRSPAPAIGWLPTK